MSRRAFHTVLIVEPSLVEQKRLRQVALRAGFERVLLAADGLQAAKTMGGELVDLVLTPWDAAELAGPELLRALRRRSRNRNVPVVLLDAGLRQDTVVSAVKAGVAGRLVLPAAPAQLKEILATIAAGGLPRRPRSRIRPPICSRRSVR